MLDVNVNGPFIKGTLIKTLNLWFGGGGGSPTGRRVQTLWAKHGLTPTQVLRLVPETWSWSAADVEDETAIARKLGDQQLAWFAQKFGVRRAWLEGQDEQIYDWPLGYKQPEQFVKHLETLGWVDRELKMTVLAAEYRRGEDASLGTFTLVFSHPIAEWDDGREQIYAHVNFDWGMMFDGHPPCMWDALVLTRWYHERARRFGHVPIVACQRQQVEAVSEGREFPGPLIPESAAGFDQLQDRAIEYQTPRGVCVPEPSYCLDDALAYGRRLGLIA